MVERLFSSRDVPCTDEFFDECSPIRIVRCELRRTTVGEMMLQEITIQTLEESHGRIYLMSDISTVCIFFYELRYFSQGSLCLLDRRGETLFICFHSEK